MTCIISTIVPSFVQLVRFLFDVPGVDVFLSEKISQDPLEKFFGLQRQRGKTNDNPTTVEFLNDTEHLRVINSVCQPSIRSNCRGAKGKDKRHAPIELDKENTPLPKRKNVRKTS